MANRVITFPQSPIQQRLQENPLEVFLDLSLNSHYADHSLCAIQTIDRKDPNYVTLKAEDKQLEFILDEENTTEDDYTKILMHIVPSDYKNYVLDESSQEEHKTNILSIDNKTYELERLVNVKAIRNSLHNIFSWIPGERVLLPEFGSNLRKLLYEGITDYNVELIIAEIKHIVSKWEPRVLIVNVVDASTVDDHENNTVHIKVIFVIPGLSDEQFEYDYVLPIAEY